MSKIYWLADKYGFKKGRKLIFKLANEYGLERLERNLGLMKETPNVKNKTAYLIGMFKKQNEETPNK